MDDLKRCPLMSRAGVAPMPCIKEQCALYKAEKPCMVGGKPIPGKVVPGGCAILKIAERMA